jgi:(R,R)-butanediol dehydrogenase/meso-butanediol dehydrogenase/diacetyl reductase
MKAARYYGNHDIRIEDIDQQTLEPGTVRIDVAWCGICGTDLHEYLDGPIFCPTCDTPHPISGETAPVTLGHEFSGVISEVGEGVTISSCRRPRRRRALHPPRGRGHLRRQRHLPPLRGHELHRPGGTRRRTLGEHRRAPSAGSTRSTTSLPLDEAALIEPLSVGYHAVKRCRRAPRRTAPARSRVDRRRRPDRPAGRRRADRPGRHRRRVRAVRRCAARRPWTPASPPSTPSPPPRWTWSRRSRSSPNGKGADVAFECTSVQVVLDTLMDVGASPPACMQVVVSIWGQARPTVDLHKLVMKELDVRGTIGYVNSHPETIKPWWSPGRST